MLFSELLTKANINLRWLKGDADVSALTADSRRVSEGGCFVAIRGCADDGHRFIPATPSESDNPIFSVYQTDIICYGRNLLEYLENELSLAAFGKQRYQISEPVKVIPFWSHLVDLNNGLVADEGV